MWEAAQDKPQAGSVFMNKGNYPMGLNGGYKMSELENKGAENLTEVQETAKEKKKREKMCIRDRLWILQQQEIPSPDILSRL